MSLVSTVPSIGIVTTDLNVQKQVSPVLAHTMVVEPPQSLRNETEILFLKNAHP